MPFFSHKMTQTAARNAIVSGLLFLVAACGGGESATAPTTTPAAIKIQGGNNQTGIVGAVLPVALTVLVTDAGGAAIANANVSWDVSAGAGRTSQSDSRTDARGITSVTWTLGSNSGTSRLTAQVGGVTPATFTATAQPSSATSVVALPDVLALGVGDTVTVRGTARDGFGNEVSGSALTFSTPDAAATVSGTGLVTAVAIGSARIIVASGGKADTVAVTVGAAGSSVCGALAVTTMTAGQVITPTVVGNSARICLAGGSANAEYGLVASSASPVFATTNAFDVYALGLTPPTAPIVAGAVAALNSNYTFDMGVGAIEAPDLSARINRNAEFARHEIEHTELTPLVGVARESYNTRQAARFAGASLIALPSVGDTIKLNSQALYGCTNAAIKGAVVKAVGTHSIVVADTSNPVNGYSLTDYQAVSATFDTLVYPLDTDNFGTPSDVSGNGHIILFFTSAVNALTPANSSYLIGGFFFSRDLYPKTAKNGLPACAGSNETEMFYLLVPDPNGVVNGNRRSLTDVTRLNLATLAHEFQHLINSSRRLYVNTGAAPTEETWLDEGLAHTAEELLYFKISGFGSRENLNLAAVTAPSQGSNFSYYMAQNFGRLYEHIRNPELTSPYATDDSLSTRGATWNFLRYAAGQQPDGTEQAFFRSIVNSTTTGLANLGNVLPNGQLQQYFANWNVALLTDDYQQLPQGQLDARYKFPSWNFRSIYPNLRISGGAVLGTYPLLVRTLSNNSAQRLTLAGGGATYMRFALPAGKTGVVSLSTNGGAPASALKFSIVRLR
jgi:hypothetical protein